MSLWRQISRGVRALTRRSSADRDIADEVQDYLEHETAAQAARGLSPEAARRAARLEMGGVARVTEDVRSYGWENTLESAIADVRYAARGLFAAPGFTAIAVLTLAVGLGGTTAIVSALKPIVFEPLSYPDAHRVAAIREIARTGQTVDGTFGMYRYLVERSRAFESMAVMRTWQPTLIGAGEPERLAGQRVTAGYFAVLGVPPALGADFRLADDQPNAPNVVILSDALWQRRFGGDPQVIGRTMTLDNATYVVAGVMPRAFDNAVAPAAEIWAPLQYEMSQGRAWGHHLRTIGRLQPGVTMTKASQEVDELAQAALQELRPPTYGGGMKLTATWLGDELTRSIKPTLLAITGAVALVLVIACVNVTNLLLARGVRRRGEFALRMALGAGRRRLVRLLLTESLLLAGAGAAVGLGVAALGVRALVALSPPGLPRALDIRVDAGAFLFALALTSALGMLVGLMPAVQASRSDPQQDLLHGSRRTAGGHQRTRRILVVAEVALALVLLVGSGLLLRSLQQLFAIPAGFDASRILTMQIQAAGRQFESAAAAAAFFDQDLQAAHLTPGVTAAALTTQLPLSGDRDEYGVHFASFSDQCCSSFRYAVSPGYLEAMRISLRQGRLFTADDRDGMARVAIVSESLAASRFGTASPLGEQLRIGPNDGPLFTIVGVVGDLKQLSLAVSESNAVYTTISQSPFPERTLSLVARVEGRPETVAPALRRAIASADRSLLVTRVAAMEDLVAATGGERRFALVLFEIFALAALVLAAAGIYGLLAGSVAERTREIGVRSALGATRGAIVGLIVRQCLTLTGLGIALGLAGATVASGLLATLLFRVSRLDLVTYAGVVALLIAVALLACIVPAVRAARVDPVTTLRAE